MFLLHLCLVLVSVTGFVYQNTDTPESHLEYPGQNPANQIEQDVNDRNQDDVNIPEDPDYQYPLPLPESTE